ncbi:MAG: glycosyltransferase family 1 protein, partial [Acidobacteria bacterium Pan2503]|nr:glycosyltransferase family 1 protein [Candidatus Acidoferrum panamensis]
MKVLVLHCRYTEPGGEDLAVASEEQLLATRGHTVLSYRRSNAEIDPLPMVQKAVLPL